MARNIPAPSALTAEIDEIVTNLRPLQTSFWNTDYNSCEIVTYLTL